MKKLNNKRRIILIMVLTLSLSLMSCNNNNNSNNNDNDNNNNNDNTESTKKSNDNNDDSDDNTPLETESTNFSSIEILSDMIQEGVDELGELVEDVENMDMSIGFMPHLFINDTLVMSTLLDFAMNANKDTYDTGISRFPVGEGEGGSSLSKEGNVYTWTHQSFFDDGNDYQTTVVYDIDKQFVDITQINLAGDLINPLHVQIQRSGDTIIASKSELIMRNNSVFQLVFFYDGEEIYSAQKRGLDIEYLLPVDLSKQNITSWSDLVDESFTTTYYYDGVILNFDQ